VKINIPHMLIGLRELQHHGRSKRPSWARLGERLAYRLSKEVLCRPWLYRLALAAARFLLRQAARDGWVRRLPGPGGRWTAARDFPAPAARSFRRRWNELADEKS
jgi:L-lactate dehydrogenase complex protein LldF